MITMLIPKIEPSKNGVIVGGTVNSLLILVKNLNKSAYKINIVTSVPSNKISIFKRVCPKYIGWQIIKNDSPPQTVMFCIVFLVNDPEALPTKISPCAYVSIPVPPKEVEMYSLLWYSDNPVATLPDTSYVARSGILTGIYF